MIASTTWEDEFVGEMDWFQRCLWIGLFSACADDQGRLLDNPILIRAKIFPYDDLDLSEIEKGLSLFEDYGKIIRYEKHGKKYIQITQWWKNQNPRWASNSKLPAPDNWIDKIRTRINGEYVTENWDLQAGLQEDAESENLASSYEHDTCHPHTVRQYPIPVPVPVPVPDKELSANAPTYEPCDDDGLPVKRKKPKKSSEPVHPSIIAFRRLTGRYPPKITYEQVIAVLGDRPDEPKMKRCYQEWCSRGYNNNSIKWLIDWYAQGGPPNGKLKENKPKGWDAVTAEMQRLEAIDGN
jgi:hypothetical protein